MTIEELGLRVNPFENINPVKGQDLIWAGMPGIKAAITEIYRESYKQTSRKIVLNWGPYGGGKTHAAFYFQKNRLPEIPSENQIHFYTTLPKNGSASIRDFVIRCFEFLGSKAIHEILSASLALNGRDKLVEVVHEKVRNETWARTILAFAESMSPDLLFRYLNDGIPKAKLTQYRLFKPLKSNEDFADLFAAFVVAATLNAPRRIFLWVDEMEDLIGFPAKDFKAFTQMIRDLTDKIGEKIIVFLNLTLAENEEQTLRYLMGDALWSRVNQKIRFEEFTLEEGIAYCVEMIKSAQLSKTDGSEPFTESAIRQMLDLLPLSKMTPREINKAMSQLINYSIDKGVRRIDEKVVVDFKNANSLV